jgi:hypothetical protein
MLLGNLLGNIDLTDTYIHCNYKLLFQYKQLFVINFNILNECKYLFYSLIPIQKKLIFFVNLVYSQICPFPTANDKNKVYSPFTGQLFF